MRNAKIKSEMLKCSIWQYFIPNLGFAASHYNNWKLLYNIMGKCLRCMNKFWALLIPWEFHFLRNTSLLPWSPVILYYCKLFSLINVDLHKSFLLKHHNNIYFHQNIENNTNSSLLVPFILLFASSCLPKIHYIHCHIFLLLSGW